MADSRSPVILSRFCERIRELQHLVERAVIFSRGATPAHGRCRSTGYDRTTLNHRLRKL